MFLPFLLALSVAMGAINRKDKVSYILWAVLLIVTILSFIHHMTNSLTLSFLRSVYENASSSNNTCSSD
ncbi:hypothetical protein LFZ32_03720 [Salmonella enterica subsp. enterica serovar Newport str. L0167]|nr:hypothetical protein LFZ32_03720 [Salmonella enterica subsp. enterica serovar Newport str. L0167]